LAIVSVVSEHEAVDVAVVQSFTLLAVSDVPAPAVSSTSGLIV
jgi:hypothetical protein